MENICDQETVCGLLQTLLFPYKLLKEDLEKLYGYYKRKLFGYPCVSLSTFSVSNGASSFV